MNKDLLALIKEFAAQNWVKDETEHPVSVTNGECDVTNPWYDRSGRFPLSDEKAEREWGKELIIAFCNCAMEHMVLNVDAVVCADRDRKRERVIFFGDLATGQYYMTDSLTKEIRVLERPFDDEDDYCYTEEWLDDETVGRFGWEDVSEEMLKKTLFGDWHYYKKYFDLE